MIILFDLGGVFVPDSTEALHGEMAEYVGMTKDELADQWRDSSHLLFPGKISIRDFYANLRAGGDPDQLTRKHIEIYQRYYRLDQHMLTLLSQVKTRYATACFSNTELEIAEVNRKQKSQNSLTSFDFLASDPEDGVARWPNSSGKISASSPKPPHLPVAWPARWACRGIRAWR